jgi:DNA-binding transcriptional LysR family regulator
VEHSLRNLQEMAVFARVGQLGSISGAARALGMPKSSVSRAVSRLEQAYGARLIERTTRQVSLTEIGRALHAHCLRMVAEAEEADAEIAAYQGNPSGRLRVAMPTAVGYQMLGSALPDFLARYPEVDLHLQLTDRRLNPVEDGFDVVVRVGRLEDSSAIARKIVDVNAVLVASRFYVERNGLPEAPEELERHAVIGFPFLDSAGLELVRGRERVQVPTWKRFACNDPLLNLELVKQGIAIAPGSRFVIGELLAAGELVRVLPGYELFDPPAVHALYASRTAVSPKVSVFLDFLTELAARFTAARS